MNIKRLLIIDKCLSDKTRSWTLEDLIEACSTTEKNSRRSVQADIELMRNKEKGYSAPIVVVDRKYYTYSDENYSLLRQHLTELDKSNITTALLTIRDYCMFKDMKGVDKQLFTLHNHIAKSLGMPLPERFNREGEDDTTTVRLWIEYEIAEEIRNNPLHSSQQVEFEEIDGSINIVLNLPITDEFEAYLVQNIDKVKVTYPITLQNKIKKQAGL